LGVDGVSVVTAEAAEESLYAIDNAQNVLNNSRGVVGAQMNRLEHRLNQIGIMSENMSSAESRIRDLDMAKEMTQFTKNQILAQTSTAMLAQANMMPQLVLQLLGA
jgi:flagellin